MAVSMLQMMLAISSATMDDTPGLLAKTSVLLPAECLSASNPSCTSRPNFELELMATNLTPVGPAESAAPAHPLPDFAAIARTMRLAGIHRRRRIQAEIAFRDLQIVVTKATRLTTAARHVQRTLTDCLRAEDKYSFARLNNGYANACKKLTSSTTHPRLPGSWPGAKHSLKTGAGFLEDLSPITRAQLVETLTSLRYDSGFIAKRLGTLSQRQLATLLPDGGTSRSSGSVFGSLSRASSRSTQPLGYLVDSLLDDLSTSRFRTPLETLVHIHMPVIHHSPDAVVHLKVWAEACAMLIEERRPAGTRLLPSLLDIWSSHVTWTGKEKLRSWLVRTLRQGHFLLESNRPSFSARVYGQPKIDAAARAEAFYADSVTELLDVLGDKTGSSAIPDGAIVFCHAVYDALRLSPANQNGLSSFVLTRWLFASFMPDLLVSPESYGLLIDHHISDLARQRICHEIALRARKVVSDVYYDRPFAPSVATETRTLVHRVAARLQFATSTTLGRLATPPAIEGASGTTFVNICAADALAIMKVLYPPSEVGNAVTDSTGVRSSASSMSGFSLFRATDFTEQQWTATPYNIPGAEDFPTLFSVPNTEQPATPSLPADVTDTLVVRRACGELTDCVTTTDASSDSTWSVLIAQEDEHKLTSHHCRVEDATHLPLPLHACCSIRDVLKSLLDNWDSLKLDLNGTDVGSPARSSDLLTVLLDRTDTRRAACEAASDFVGAHRWMEYADMIDSYDTSDGRIALLNNIAAILRDAESDVDYVLASLKQYEMWEITTATLLSATLRSMVPPTKLCAQLRTKMWYHADVRTTGVYDNLRSVANALRAMYKSAKLAGPILPGTIPTRGVASPNLVASAGQWKSESMVLDLLGVAAAHGGPNKLNDMHVKQVQAWRQRSQIHSVCEGEERIHKFCMEVRKCVDHFTTIGTLEDTVQQSARSSTQQQHYSYVLKPDTGNDPHAYLRHRANSLTLQTQVAPSIDSISTASHTLSNASSREYFDGRSPTLTSKSSATFWSPTLSEAQSPSSATSVGSYAPPVNIEKKFSKEITDTTDLASLKRDFTGLLLSEIGDVLFAHGSETDQAFWDGVGGELTQSHLSGARTSLQEQLKSLHASRTLRHASQRQPFDYYGAIRQLFKLFGSADDPHSKLWYLGRVQELLIPFMAPPMQDRKSAHENTETSATPSQASPPLGRYNPDGDAAIEGFYLLFAEPTLRPAFLFRDLQYIASLLPSSVLESQPDGKSFWNAVAAVTRIKNEMCKIYIETADTIIDFHTKARGHSRSSSQAQQQRDDASFPSPSRTPPLDSGTKYTMSDAAHLLQIAAKEGLPVAQCELATLYLTHPDLMERVLAPWALPKEVFREEIEGRSKREKDLDRYDPGTMCVAIHWMVKAAEGGDALAKAHLRQREEMEKLG